MAGSTAAGVCSIIWSGGGMRAAWILVAASFAGCMRSHEATNNAIGVDGGLGVGDADIDDAESCDPPTYRLYAALMTPLDAEGDGCPDSGGGYLRPRDESWLMLPACHLTSSPTSSCSGESVCALYDSRGITRWTTVKFDGLDEADGAVSGVISIEMRARDADGSEHVICEGEYAYDATPID